MKRFMNNRSQLAVSSLAAAGLLAMAPLAHADSPTTRQLLDKCNNGTDSCVFHPSGPMETYRGDYKLAGGATNCSPGTSTRVIRWESSETTTNSVGVTISANIGFGEAFEVGFETSYNHEWSWSSSKADEIRHQLGPYQGVNIYAAPMHTRVTGTYELHFGYKYYGHYYWYVNNITIDGPSDNAAWDTRVVAIDPSC